MERFIGIIWLSARDIDLLPQGPKLVKPAVLTTKDIAREVAALFQPKGWDQKGFDAEKYVSQSLGRSEEGPLLLIFDNFETVQQPVDVFNWLDTYVRPPNKILITTRHRDFRGDYAVQVGGMTEAQCDQLVHTTAASLGLRAPVTSGFCKDVYRESEGHPYVVKVLVGEAVEGNRLRKIERIVAGRDDLLDALFERTYARLSPAAKRVFLTLCNWRSLVAHLALDAALLRPSQVERIDIPATLEDLRRVSFIDEHVSPKDGRVFLSVPLVGSVFGKRKLSVSPDRIEIESDTRFLQRFGPMQPSDVQYGIEPRIHRLFRSLSDELGKRKLDLAAEKPVLELIARSYPPAWLMIADLWRESGHTDALSEVKSALSRYMETAPPTDEQRAAWERVAAIERQRNNWFEFVNAQVHIAELPEANIATISAVVNTFNSVSRHLESDAEARLAIARRLAAVMEPKIATGDATDCSRLAWVLIHSGSADRALEIIDCGLRLDPTNEYCRKLKAKVWERIAEKKRLQGDLLGFLDAAVNMVEVPGTDIGAISSVANDFNQLVRQLDADPEARRDLARRLSAAMHPQISNGDAVDCSRLAWLMVHAGKMDGVLDVVERGLQIDPQSEYCLNLKTKFGPTADVH
jgi:tetratricopeptide (TPR) repeat protein